MLAHQRQEVILDAVRSRGGVRVADLVERLGVSEMTVRRDIGELSRRGLVARVHGGAAAVGRSSEEPGFAAKSTPGRSRWTSPSRSTSQSYRDAPPPARSARTEMTDASNRPMWTNSALGSTNALSCDGSSGFPARFVTIRQRGF